MKKFKIFDFWISILLMAIFVVSGLIKWNDTFIRGYYIVGCWQSISMLVHVYNRCFTYKGGARNTYHWVSLFCLLSLPIGSYFLLIFIAPFMAIFYTWLCYIEVTVKMQRPLAVLK